MDKKNPIPTIHDFVEAAKKGTREAYKAKKAREASSAKMKASEKSGKSS